MDWPISQRITDLSASSQQETGHSLSKHVPCGDKVGTKVTELGLVILATSEFELEQAVFTLQQAVPGLMVGKPQLNYIYVDGDKFLEPYSTVIVDVPEESAAHVLADLLSRRARLESEIKLNGLVTIKAEAPMSELFGYSTSLRLLTQSRGSFKQTFSGYRSGPSMDGTGFEHA